MWIGVHINNGIYTLQNSRVLSEDKPLKNTDLTHTTITCGYVFFKWWHRKDLVWCIMMMIFKTVKYCHLKVFWLNLLQWCIISATDDFRACLKECEITSLKHEWGRKSLTYLSRFKKKHMGLLISYFHFRYNKVEIKHGNLS